VTYFHQEIGLAQQVVLLACHLVLPSPQYKLGHEIGGVLLGLTFVDADGRKSFEQIVLILLLLIPLLLALV
jgi:hypothetical protein